MRDRQVKTACSWVLILALALSAAWAGATRAQVRDPSSGAPVQYDPVVIGGKKYPVFGKRISKSGSARLAVPTKRGWAWDVSTYLPAGKILLVTKTCQNDRRNKQWCLTVTEDGLMLFVRSDGLHFFKADGWSGDLAVALTDSEGTATKDGRTVPFSASEVLPIAAQGLQDLFLMVDSSSQKSGFDDPEEVKVPDDPRLFAIVTIADVLKPEAFAPIVPVRANETANLLMQAIETGELDGAARAQIVEDISNILVIDTKTCAVELGIDLSAAAELGLETGKFLSVVKAKLGLTGEFAGALKYPQGLEFEASRFVQLDPEGGVPRFFELWLEKRYGENGCQDVVLTRVMAEDDEDYGGFHGSIDSNDLVEGVNFSATTKLPQYSCRDEYLRLIDHLTQEDGNLTTESAALMVANMARFTGARDAAKCDSGN